MYSIDLVKFAEHSQKIPGKFLFNERIESKQYKIALAYALDFFIVLQASSFATVLMSTYFAYFMSTDLLMDMYDYQGMPIFDPIVFTLVAISYFYAACFFNQGKTFGMSKMKSRIKIEAHDHKASILQALYALSLFFTFGLSSVLKRKEDHVIHDDLYHQMMGPNSYYLHPNLFKPAPLAHQVTEIRELKVAA